MFYYIAVHTLYLEIPHLHWYKVDIIFDTWPFMYFRRITQLYTISKFVQENYDAENIIIFVNLLKSSRQLAVSVKLRTPKSSRQSAVSVKFRTPIIWTGKLEKLQVQNEA